VDEVKAAGLRGRGGAAFPAGVKWSFLAPSKAPVKYVLCNCEEGDPGAFNDKGIIENDPHTLIEGLIINGYATRSTHVMYLFEPVMNFQSKPLARQLPMHMKPDCSERTFWEQIFHSKWKFH